MQMQMYGRDIPGCEVMSVDPSIHPSPGMLGITNKESFVSLIDQPSIHSLILLSSLYTLLLTLLHTAMHSLYIERMITCIDYYDVLKHVLNGIKSHSHIQTRLECLPPAKENIT